MALRITFETPNGSNTAKADQVTKQNDTKETLNGSGQLSTSLIVAKISLLNWEEAADYARKLIIKELENIDKVRDANLKEFVARLIEDLKSKIDKSNCPYSIVLYAIDILYCTGFNPDVVTDRDVIRNNYLVFIRNEVEESKEKELIPNEELRLKAKQLIENYLSDALNKIPEEYGEAAEVAKGLVKMLQHLISNEQLAYQFALLRVKKHQIRHYSYSNGRKGEVFLFAVQRFIREQEADARKNMKDTLSVAELRKPLEQKDEFSLDEKLSLPEYEQCGKLIKNCIYELCKEKRANPEVVGEQAIRCLEPIINSELDRYVIARDIILTFFSVQNEEEQEYLTKIAQFIKDQETLYHNEQSYQKELTKAKQNNPFLLFTEDLAVLPDLRRENGMGTEIHSAKTYDPNQLISHLLAGGNRSDFKPSA